MKQMLSRAATILIWLSLIYACYELGIWQLHRAQALNVATAPKPDQPLIELNKRKKNQTRLLLSGFK
jgi:cytochrome oxidase assembly protein ShyY1